MWENIRKTPQILVVLFFALILFACKSETGNSENGAVQIKLDLLLGKWVAIDDDKNVIELTKDRMFSYYDGLKLADEALVIYHNCLPRYIPEGREVMPCLVTDGKRVETCFEVVELTENSLHLSLVERKGDLRKFKKLK
jgi:hypothetical protein